MRKIGVYVLVFLSLIGCENEIYEPISLVDTIVFSVDTIQIKGVEFTTATLASMSVFSYATGENLFNTTSKANMMYNAEVKREDDNRWTTTQPPVEGSLAITEWKGTEYHSFFAFAPYGVDKIASSYFSAIGDQGPPTFHYTLPDKPTDHIDLLYSAVTNTKQYYIGNKPVAFTFNHALSKIVFSAKKENPYGGAAGEKVIVKGIAFSNIWSSSTLTFDVRADGVVTGGKWVECKNHPKEHDMSTSIENGGLLPETPLEDILANITTSAGALMVIPQVFDTDATMTVVMDVTSKPGGVVKEYVQQFKLSEMPLKSWEIGMSYRYQFQYSGKGILSSSVTVHTTPWDSTAVNVNVEGSFLNLSDVSYKADKPIKIHYTTDYTGDVQATSLGGHGTITQDVSKNGYFEYTPNGSIAVDKIEIKAGRLKRTIQVALHGTHPSKIEEKRFATNSYVGAFWRAEEFQERLINMYTSDNLGWSVKVLWLDEYWNPKDDDIILDTNYPATMPENSNPQPITSENITIEGTGLIKFRIGLRAKYKPTKGAPARYAVVLVETEGGIKHLLYIRQGENPDYLMRPTDKSPSLIPGASDSRLRPMANKFAVYNLTAPSFKDLTGIGGSSYNDHPQLDINGADFVDYPTQAGAFFQHMVKDWEIGEKNTYARRAYHPTNESSAISGWNANEFFTDYWTTLQNDQAVSPQNTLINGITYRFRRSNDGTISELNTLGEIKNSEVRQSLWFAPQAGVDAVANNDNATWGYYADGFFDRRVIGYAPGSTSIDKLAVSTSNSHVAYIGSLFYNKVTCGSLFFPAAGERRSSSGALGDAGKSASYWTASTNFYDRGYIFSMNSNWVLPMIYPRTAALPLRPVVQ
jgi:hypothetical protein